jgi:glycosyltransferase involved in cell wall biosynthesis
MRSDLSVLHVLPTISRKGGGVSESTRQLVLALAKDLPGRVSVLTTRDEFSKEDRGGWGDVPVSFVRAFPPYNYGFAPGLVLELFRRRRTIVHLHGLWGWHCAAVLVWSWFSRGRVVITIHGMLDPWILRRSPRLKWLVSHLYQNRLIARADCLHVLTVKEREDATRVCPQAPTAIIPGFVTPDEVAVTGRPIWWEPSLEGREIFLFLGRLHKKKGCSELLQAWQTLSAVPAFRDKYELIFCGWSDGAEAFLAELAEVRERLGNVRYVGAQFGLGEKERTFDAARFFILPSKSEGVPRTILEAWQAGLVVIMTAQCNLPIGFSRGAALETGPTKDRIAESMMRAAQMPEQDRRAMAEAGKKLVEEFYSRGVVTRAMLQLYTDVDAGKIRKNPSAAKSKAGG